MVVIFSTTSPIEAGVVRALLASRGILSLVSSDAPSMFPLSVTMGGVQLSVQDADADEARRLIDSHLVDRTAASEAELQDTLDALEGSIGYRFRDRGLLEHALTHTSRANEDASGSMLDNESLEFLGDAVLGFLVADVLFREFPSYDEGQKSKAKAALVSAQTLARQAERLNLGTHLLLGRGEEKTGGRRKQALLADGYEALIASIYLDGGVEEARAFIAREFEPLIAELKAYGASGQPDYKSTLQEYLQSRQQPLPEYRLAGSAGPDHEKQFEVAVCVGDAPVARATGRSKKEAEQVAARLALELLKSRD